jgi:hypothetical protein
VLLVKLGAGHHGVTSATKRRAYRRYRYAPVAVSAEDISLAFGMVGFL